MGDVAFIWSAMGSMFMLFIGYVVWEQKQHASHDARMAAMEKSRVEDNLTLKKECADAINNLRSELTEKIATIDKTQSTEFVKINTQLSAIQTQITTTQTQLSDVARLIAGAAGVKSVKQDD